MHRIDTRISGIFGIFLRGIIIRKFPYGAVLLVDPW